METAILIHMPTYADGNIATLFCTIICKSKVHLTRVFIFLGFVGRQRRTDGTLSRWMDSITLLGERVLSHWIIILFIISITALEYCFFTYLL